MSLQNPKSTETEDKLLSRTSTIGDSDTVFDIHELKKRIEPIIRDPHSMLHFPNYRDYDREIKYSLSSIGHWLMRIPTRTRIYTKGNRSFIFCKHTTFDNVSDIAPRCQQKRIATSYRLSRIARRFPPFYSLAFHTEYGKTSFWEVSHLRDIITDQLFAHGISMRVMIDGATRRPQTVVPEIRAICDMNFLNDYPKEFKFGVYPKLKQTCSEHITLLNDVRAKKEKTLLYSLPIQMRFHDEDQNKHLNTNTYARYCYEGIMSFDAAVRSNRAVIFWMTNVFWREIRMQNYSHCFFNVWQCNAQSNGRDTVYVGTIDVDEATCARNGDVIQIDSTRDVSEVEWTHCHGFMVKVVNVEAMESKL